MRQDNKQTLNHDVCGESIAASFTRFLSDHRVVPRSPSRRKSQVIKLMQSFTSKELVKEIFSWRYYYWYLTNEGIEYLREYLNLSADVVPNTLKKSTRPATRPMADERPRGGDRYGGPGGRPGGREGYRSERPGGYGRGGGDKGGAPGGFAPSFA